MSDCNIESENQVKFSNKSHAHYSSCGPTSGHQVPEIINSINKLEIDTNIKNHAINCYNELASERVDCKTKSVKGVNKASLVFYCVYIGFIKAENIVDPYYVAELIPLSSRKVNKALNRYIKPGCTMVQPEELLTFYINNINKYFGPIGFSFDFATFHKDVIELINTCRNTVDGKNWIAETSSRIICITAIYFYLNDVKGFPVNKHEKVFTKAVYSSKACIKKYHIQFTNYYNSMSTSASSSTSTSQLPVMKKTFSALNLFGSDSEEESDSSQSDYD